MPELMLREPPNSLLGQTCRLVVQRQISYAAERGIPWGISESAFNARNLEMTYQYSNFGVPGLGFRRRLGDDLVVAPYAAGLAAMIDPLAAARNFERLAALGGRGPYGFYEALDFTPARLPAGSECAIVRAYMAHHQGMTLVALANVLRSGVMRARFHADPVIQASELLLQERTPRDVPVARRREEDARPAREEQEPARPIARRYTSPHGAALEWPLQRHDNGRRRRLQSLARSRGHTLA
jgi:cyclic beta-1,2-glucan synthetase